MRSIIRLSQSRLRGRSCCRAPGRAPEVKRVCWEESTDASRKDFNGCRYVLQDRDAKFCAEFRQTLAAGGVKCLRLPPRSPNLNAFAERWVRSVKDECLSKLILCGEASLRRALTQFQEHYHSERNHQGKGNVLLFPPWRGTAEEPGTINRG